MTESGFEVGRNVAFEYRYANGNIGALLMGSEGGFITGSDY
jgi:hypothetical protein